MAAVLKEKNNTGVAVSMLSLPSVAGPYLEEGWVRHAQTWNPAAAGYASNAIALKLLQEEEISSGADLGQEGYGDVTVDGKLVTGDAILELEKGTFAPGEYPF